MTWGAPDPKTNADIMRKAVKRLMEDDAKKEATRRRDAALKRHAKALPTGCGLSKADRKKLNAAIARTIHRVDAENRAGLHARQRLNIVRSTPGITSKSRADFIMSDRTNKQLAMMRDFRRSHSQVLRERGRVGKSVDKDDPMAFFRGPGASRLWGMVNTTPAVHR